MQWRQNSDLILILAMLCVGLAAPFVLSNAWLRLLTDAWLLMTAAQLWNLLAGFGGIVSVGQHAFVGAGAYAFFGLATLAGLPPYLALALTIPFGMLLALPVFALVMRLRTAYFAIGSWVVAEVLMLVAGKLPGFGGGSGLSLNPAMVRTFGENVSSRIANVYWLAFDLLMVSLVIIVFMLRSRFGYALRAMRDNEPAAVAFGVHPARVRAILFIISGGLLAAVGAINTLQKLRINPSASFGLLDWTVYVMFVVVIGGLGRIGGPIIGAILFLTLREVFADWGVLYMIALGLLTIAVMVLEPGGVAGLVTRAMRWMRGRASARE